VKRISLPMRTVLACVSCAVGICAPTAASNVTGYFSSTYDEARSKFIAAASLAGARIDSFKNPVSGPEGGPLFTDVAVFGTAEADTILVLGSGTHGVEGFAGSAIQTGLIREGFITKLKPGIGLLVVHAINPYGFSHLRRFDENNVDLNRNFVDHSQPYPENEGYDRLAKLLEPDTLSLWSKFKTQIGLAWYRLTKGKNWLQRAVSQGQYTHSQGLFFGGHSDSWSNNTLRELVKKYLFKAKRIVMIEFHTGLGEFAGAEVIVGEKVDSPVYRRANEIWGNLVKPPGDSVSPPIRGSLKYAFARLSHVAEVTPVSLEFGTYPPMDVFWALWRENHLHHHRSEHQLNEQEIKTELLRVFYPDIDDWREKVWKQGKVVVEQALDYMQ